MWKKIGLLRKIFRFLFCFLMEKAYRVKEEGKKNLEKIKEHLKVGSVIFVFNHISLEDAPILLSLLYLKTGKEINRIIIPASKKHWKSFLLGKLMRLSCLFGVEAFPIVQHYERGLYLPAEILHLDRCFLKAAKKTLSEIGGVIVIVPEDRRGFEKIQEFQSGIKTLIKMGAKNGYNALVAPVGIEIERNFNRNINLGKKFTVRFGEPISIHAIDTESKILMLSSRDLIRKKLAEILPSSYSGSFS